MEEKKSFATIAQMFEMTSAWQPARRRVGWKMKGWISWSAAFTETSRSVTSKSN